MKYLRLLLIILLINLTGILSAADPAISGVSTSPTPAYFPQNPGDFQTAKFRIVNATPSGTNNSELKVMVRLSKLRIDGEFNPATHVQYLLGEQDWSWTYDDETTTLTGSLSGTMGPFEGYEIQINNMNTTDTCIITDPKVGLEVQISGPADANSNTDNDTGTNYTYTVEPVPTPIILSGFSGYVRECQAYLKWSSKAEVNFSGYTIQSSTDGIRFKDIAFIPGKGSSSYAYLDSKNSGAVFYYRLKMTDNDGKTDFSPVTAVDLNCDHSFVRVFPNPASSQANVQLNIPEGRYRIDLINSAGHNIRSMSANVSHEGDNRTFNELDKYLPGSYTLKVTEVQTGVTYQAQLIVVR